MSEGDLVQNTDSGMVVDMNNITPPETTQLNEAQQAFSKYYGENEAFKEFVSTENPFETLAQKFAEKPAGITLPGENATPEEWAAFNKAIGAGENLEAYKYEGPTSDDEAIKKHLPTEQPFIKAFQEVALKAGMPIKAWNEITAAYNEMIVQDIKTDLEVSNQAAKKLSEEFNQKFGQDGQKVIAAFQRRYADVSPAEKAVLDSLSQEQLMVLAAKSYDFEKQYIKEDVIDSTGKVSTSMSQADFLNKLSNLYTQKSRAEMQHGGFSNEVKQIEIEIEKVKNDFAGQKA